MFLFSTGCFKDLYVEIESSVNQIGLKARYLSDLHEL